MAANQKAEQDIPHIQIQHDKVAKAGLKHKGRFKAVVKYRLPPKQFDALDFDRFEFIDTEVLIEKFGGDIELGRADVIAKIGLKDDMDKVGSKKETLVCIIVEHKSRLISKKDLFLQTFKYHEVLFKQGIYPLITIVVAHCKEPVNIPSDLQSFFGWTPKMKEIFGESALNFHLYVVDLNQETEADIIDRAGMASALFYALKNVWNMTREKIRSVIALCWRESKEDIESYKEYAGFLGRYMFQASSEPVEIIGQIEKEVIKDEEGVMISTYDRAVHEGMAQGMEKGIVQGMEKNRREVALNLLKTTDMDVQTISQVTGLSQQEVFDLKKTYS